MPGRSHAAATLGMLVGAGAGIPIGAFEGRRRAAGHARPGSGGSTRDYQASRGRPGRRVVWSVERLNDNRQQASSPNAENRSELRS